MSLLIHGEAESEDRGSYLKTLESIRRDYPELVGTMLPKSANEIRSILKRKGIERPDGLTLREIPIVKLDPPFWEPHFNNFARKLMLAFHYQCFGAPLSHSGRIWSFHYSNADYIAGTFPQQMLEITPNVVQPTRQKRFLDDQFSVRWNVVEEAQTAAFLCHFHNMWAIGASPRKSLRVLTVACRQMPQLLIDGAKSLVHDRCSLYVRLMRFVRDRLIFLGLVALDEAAGACRTDPIEPSIPLRVVVAMLHALAGGDRAIFDEFLATLRMTARSENDTMADTIRHSAAHTVIHGIARRLGQTRDINLNQDIAIAQRGARFDEEWNFRRFPRLNDHDRARHRLARAFYEKTQKKDGR